MSRDYLTSNRTYNVPSDFSIIQDAWDFCVNTLDLAGYRCKIQLADGSHTGWLADGSPLGLRKAQDFEVAGNDANPENVLITGVSGTSTVSCGTSSGSNSRFYLHGVKLENAGGNWYNCAIETHVGSQLCIGNIDFGATSGHHIWTHTGGWIRADATGIYRISAGALSHIFASESAVLSIHGIAIAFPSNVVYFGSWQGSGPTWVKGRFLYAGAGGVLVFDNNTFINKANVSAEQYFVDAGGQVAVMGASATTYIPGDSAGYVAAGGIYG